MSIVVSLLPLPAASERAASARPLPAGRLVPSREDRWFGTGRTRRATSLTAAVLAASVVLHAAFLATALLTGVRAPEAPSQEIPVEIVQEAPAATKGAPSGKGGTPEPARDPSSAAAGGKPADPEPSKPVKPEAPVAAAQPPELKPALPPPAEPEVAKPEVAKPEVAKPEVAKPEVAKPEMAKPEPVKPETAKAEPVKTEPAKPEPAKPEPSRPEPSRPEPSKPEAAAAGDAERAALQNELDSLKNESAALEAEAARPEPPAARTAASAAMDALGIGSLAGAAQAVALPGESNAADAEPVGYAALVFSRLAKAKEIGRRMGRPGTAGVQFDLDGAGALTRVRLVRSSGIRELDEEAMAVVRKAAPFPAPPPGERRSFSANVSFVPGR